MVTGRPRLSAVICIYNMAREAPRTILSASLPHQQGIEAGDIEVIVVDNGSTQPLPASYRDSLPAHVRVVEMPDPRPSPVFAMNWAAREHARGDVLLFAIDGARIFSDRIYAETLKATDLIEDAFVFTMAWHLGPKTQMVSVGEGYTQEVEDRLIEESGWPARPDALFDISVFAGSCAAGYFHPIAESNAFAMRRELFERVGGYDERFTSPGAGFANLELFHRYTTRPDARNVCLLSEGTFHQVHGGVATSGLVKADVFGAEYQEIFGRPYERPEYETLYLGRVRPGARKFLRQSLDEPGS